MKQQKNRRRLSSAGFSAIEAVVIILVIAALSLGGWYEYHREHKQKTTATSTSTSHTKTPTPPPPADPYAGWKTATSPRAGFSIKYPSSWSYAETVGGKDNVEHITLDSTNFHITVDSYLGKNTDNGGAPATDCTDCAQTLSSTVFSIPGLGKASVDTVTYALDSGKGNAIILRLADGTYYIPSRDAQGVYTAFRGISNLSSEYAYQQETPGQFESNPDYAAAQKILESISY